MKKFVLILISFLLFFLCKAVAQSDNQQRVDALNQIGIDLMASYADSAFTIFNTNYQIAQHNEYDLGEGIALMYMSYITSKKGDYKTAFDYIEKSIFCLEKTKNKSDLGFAYNQFGYLKERLGEIEPALVNYQKAAQMIEKSNNQENLDIVYNNLGGYYQRRGNYTESLKYFNQTLPVVEAQKDSTLMAIVLGNIGNIHFFQQEFDKAIPYYKKSIEVRKKIGDEKGLAQVYNNLGGTLLSQFKTQEALPYLDEAAQLYKQTGNTRGYLMSQTNIGLIHYQEENYLRAIEYFERCLEMENDITDKNTLTMIYNNLAAANNQLQNYDKGIVYAQKGLEVSEEIKADKTIGDNLASLAIAYAGNKDFEKAYEYHAKYKEHQDSLFNLEKTSELNALLLEQKTYENEKLEQENKLKAVSLEKERLEKQSQVQQVAFLKKQAEADKLLVLAKEAKSEKEADSLLQEAQKAQLEADNLKIKAEKTEAEKRATEAEANEKIAFQRNLSIVFGISVVAALLIAFIAYRNQRNKQKANLLLAEKNEEIRLQNELLDDANKTKDRLFAIIAHDLRSPVLAFQEVSEQLEFYAQKQQPEKIIKTAKLLDNAAHNVGNLLNNLLHWALLQQEKQIRYQFAAYNLSEILAETLQTYQPIAEVKQIDWSVELDKKIFIWVDAPSFQTIIRNILSNATKFTPKEGKIHITSHLNEETEKAILSIHNTGKAIPKEVQENLSQKKLNSSQKGTQNEKGTGLGLLLCYEFAKANEIDINLESNDTTGTTFTFLIPKKLGKW